MDPFFGNMFGLNGRTALVVGGGQGIAINRGMIIDKIKTTQKKELI